MHTILTRLNTITTFFLTVLAVCTSLCFLSTAFNTEVAQADIVPVKVLVKNLPDYATTRERNDLGIVQFDLNADLTNLFNWNVKQLFLYLTAEYATPSNSLNQVVLWDKIIQRGEVSNLKMKNVNMKYYFWDDGNGLRGNENVTLKLNWNVIPNAGTLPLVSSTGSRVVQFPSEYTTSRA